MRRSLAIDRGLSLSPFSISHDLLIPYDVRTEFIPRHSRAFFSRLSISQDLFTVHHVNCAMILFTVDFASVPSYSQLVSLRVLSLLAGVLPAVSALACVCLHITSVCCSLLSSKGYLIDRVVSYRIASIPSHRSNLSPLRRTKKVCLQQKK